MKYTKQLFVHQISSFFQYQTTPFFVYTFVSLQTVAFYGNYTLIVDKLCQLMNTALGSTSAGIGNLIAEGNKNKIETVFWEITGIRFWIASIIAFTIYYCIDSFIVWWIGEEYLLPKTIILLLSLKIYIQISTGGIGQFTAGFGLFSDVWSSILQVILFISIAIIGGLFWGLAGIILSSIISIFIIVGLWKPYYLYTKGFKKSVWNYWYIWLKYNILTILSFVLSYVILSYINQYFNLYNIFQWLMYSICVLTIYSTISFFLYYSCIKEFQYISHRVIKIISK